MLPCIKTEGKRVYFFIAGFLPAVKQSIRLCVIILSRNIFTRYVIITKKQRTANRLSLMNVRYIEITREEDGQRLDNYLIRILKGVPKSHIYRIIRGGEVRVNKKRAAVSSRLVPGDMVRIPPIRMAADKEIHVGTKLSERLIKSIIPEDDEYKGSIEITFEVIAQIIVLVLAKPVPNAVPVANVLVKVPLYHLIPAL